jgi:uncharacterized membrane protein YcaP (DUF421 family)
MRYASPRTVNWEYRVQRLGFLLFLSIAGAAVVGYLGDRARIVASSTAIYASVLIIFRIAGRRTLSQTSTFDLVLLLIIGETTQQAMVGDDKTVPGALIAIFSLVSLDMGITYVKKVFPWFDRLLEGSPVLLVRDGKIQHEALRANSLSDEDLSEAARLLRGFTDVDQIEQATLERDGMISIVPKRRMQP